MRAEKDVAGEFVKDSKAALVIGGDLRIGLVADQFVARVHIRAADDDDVQTRPLSVSSMVQVVVPLVWPASEMRGEDRAAERDGARRRAERDRRARADSA